MSSSEKLMIAHFVEEQPDGVQFYEWPLHITLLPWFISDPAIAAAELRLIAEHMRACKVALGARKLGPVAMFGVNNDTAVRPIKNSTPLGVMHGMILSTFHQKLIDKRFIGGMYNPHLTIRTNEDPGEDFNIEVDDLSLIRHDGQLKTILSAVDLVAQKDE